MLVGESQVIRELRARIQRVAATSFTVLIEGESGAGKELVAREIHAWSDRRRGPFIAVNCAALVETLIEAELFGIEERTATGVRGRRGKFEMADDGTLFLDEVADLSPTSQAKLLRVLQDGECQRLGSEQPIHVSVRVIAATNQPLPAMIGDGRFRQDLFYRLSVVPIRIPALRERRDDIDDLVSYFLVDFCARNNVRPKRVDDGVVPILRAYDWPGNVRELRNVVERMAILTPGDEITTDAVPVEIRSPVVRTGTGLHDVRDAAERDRIRQALDDAGWNVSAAARRLGVERTNLHKRIRALGVRRDPR
jgi:two-component system nitrogen regulation response regulator NtrX